MMMRNEECTQTKPTNYDWILQKTKNKIAHYLIDWMWMKTKPNEWTKERRAEKNGCDDDEDERRIENERNSDECAKAENKKRIHSFQFFVLFIRLFSFRIASLPSTNAKISIRMWFYSRSHICISYFISFSVVFSVFLVRSRFFFSPVVVWLIFQSRMLIQRIPMIIYTIQWTLFYWCQMKQRIKKKALSYKTNKKHLTIKTIDNSPCKICFFFFFSTMLIFVCTKTTTNSV